MPKAPVLITMALVVLAGSARTDVAQTGAQTQQTAVADTRVRAEAGDAESQFRLGRMYLDGDGTPQDHVQSVAWFRKAAAQGHPKAQNNLGIACAKGLGVPQDDAQGVVWYRNAADQNYAYALYNLGLMYQAGRGVLQDPVEAFKLLTLGVVTEANPGVQQKSLAENREALAMSLTAEQRAEAERRAREWTEAHPVGQTSQPPSQAAARPALQLADVRVTPRRVNPGGSFALDIAYTAADPAGSPKAAVRLSFSILSGGSPLFESAAEIVESASGEAWKIGKPLTAAATPGTYVIRVRMALGAAVVTRDVEFEIAR